MKTKMLIAAALLSTLFANADSKPNLVIIHTDEHNFRTLGCYRDLMTPEQGFVWGEGIKVDTPHIDSLAKQGALCTKYYATYPVCSPSRASFISGLYPPATGTPKNDAPLNDGLVTFAEVLQRDGYETAYLGKWHLDGNAKPGVEPPRKFGFADNRYMFNRGHWKMLRDTENGLEAGGPSTSYKAMGDEQTFTTDFLTDRTLEFLDKNTDKPFCVMLSIPDPHGPNSVRKPYDTMFADADCQEPNTSKKAEFPRWAGPEKGNFKWNKASMQNYFGMVKCIDDNVGKILRYLKENGLEENTIVVFTSDHGDLMGEHARYNKGVPFEASAKIPFILKYPGRVPAGKVIEKAYSTADFAPTILGLMNQPQIPGTVGRDDSALFLNPDLKVSDAERLVSFGMPDNWAAVANTRYKLVYSAYDNPWLFDLQKDPDELTNEYLNPEYKPVIEKFGAALVAQMDEYSFPGKETMITSWQETLPEPKSKTKRKSKKQKARGKKQ